MEGEEVFARFLVDSGLLSRSQLEAVLLPEDEKPLPQRLVEGGLLTEDEVRLAQAKAWGVPFVTVNSNDISPEALFSIPEPFARAHSLVAYTHEGDALCVALLDMGDLASLEALNLRMPLRAHLCDRASLRRALVHYQKLLKERVAARITEAARAVVPPTSPSPADRQHAGGRIAVAQLLDELVRHALLQRAEAIHFEPSAKELRVRYRIAGDLYDALLLPAHVTHSLYARLRVLASLPFEERAENAHGRFERSVEAGSALRLLVQVSLLSFYTQAGDRRERAILELLPESQGRQGFTLASLGLHGESLERIHHALAGRGGLIVVCGLEDSGKTTLLYTLLDMLTEPKRLSVSVEEQIEAVLPQVVQTKTDPERGVFISTTVRAALRQQPDVLLISNLNDPETVELALQAANRGVVVVAGMAAANAAHSVELLGSISPRLTASALRLVISTKLVRRVCPEHTKEKLTREETNTLETAADLGTVLALLKDERVVTPSTQWKDVRFARPTSCAQCRGGYQGRVGLHEVLMPSRALRDMVLEGAGAEELRIQARAEGTLSLVEDGLYKAAAGYTSPEEVLKLLL